MTHIEEITASFEHLRELAYELDRNFGVQNRKLVLLGNEKLNYSTDAEQWSIWLESVRKRLGALADKAEVKRTEYSSKQIYEMLRRIQPPA